MCGAPSTIFHLGHIVAEFRRSPAPVEHHHRHHAVVLTELFPDTLLDRSPRIEGEFHQHDGVVTMMMFYRRRASPKHCYDIIEV